MSDEHAEVREHFAPEPGRGHHAERLLAERDNAVSHGNADRIAAIDAELAAVGWQAPASREAAAEQRRAAAREQRDKAKNPAKRPPAGRNAGPAKATTSGKDGKQ